MNKINLLHIYQNSKIGGVQQQLLSILKEYDREIITPTFCCFAPKGEIGIEIEKLGIDLVALNRSRYNKFSPGILMDLYKLVKKKNIHIIRTHRYRANLYGRLAAWFAGSPVIIASVHDNYRTDRRLGRRIINRILSKITDRMVAVSEAIKNDIIKYDNIEPSKILVIPNGIDTKKFDPERKFINVREELSIKTDDIVVGFIGRLVPAKGLEYLIDAVLHLKDKYKKLKLIIIGNGSIINDLKDNTRKNKVHKHVIFTGERRDIPDILSCIDIFVMPSVAEGLPNALLEAMAMGKPVVATKVGGIPEVIQNGINGLLVPPHDAGSLAEAIISLIDNDNLAKKIGQASREFILEHYSIRSTVHKWQSLYISILEKKGLINTHTKKHMHS